MNPEIINKIDEVIDITAEKVIKYNLSINQHIGLLSALADLVSARAEIKLPAVSRYYKGGKENGR